MKRCRMSEGRKMWLSVMAVFVAFATIFILFEDYDRKMLEPFDEVSDWHLLVFSVVVLLGLGLLLLRYARRMDERISREQTEKENKMRRELTQNIAHELKTPVASIMGYTETILNTPDIDAAIRQQFIQRTHAQAERLTALLQDISTLNRMDYASDVLAFERVDVSLLFADIVQETALSLERRQMSLHNCLPQGIIVRGNPLLLYSVFRNLVDNALNYAGKNTTIEVSAVEDAGFWHFTFADNGVGIAPEHLPRIFERFYRVDKGRSRSLGGTGLGLAIVKNAVQLHGGTIEAHATPGGGVTFLFSLRKL